MQPVIGTARLGSSSVGRLGLGLTALRPTGMWGEPARRAATVNTIRRAVELGIGLIEVPGPFGPWADLVRDAEPEGVPIVVRLTGPAGGRGSHPVDDLEVVQRRLGRHLRAGIVMVLADVAALEELRTAGVEHLGAVIGGRPLVSLSLLDGSGAVRGPYPPSRRVLEWCEERGLPYISGGSEAVGAGEHTIGLLEPTGRAEIERLHRDAVTPRAATPG